MSAHVPDVTVFWRPGCLFCSLLFKELDRVAVPYVSRNIWDDSAAAASVRLAARGNETVPTVQVGEQFLVNPTADQVIAAIHPLDADAPVSLPHSSTERPRPDRHSVWGRR